VHNGTAARLFLAFLRLSKEKNVKNELDHLKKNLLKKPKTIKIFLSKMKKVRSGTIPDDTT
jgi:hypothetical protein